MDVKEKINTRDWEIMAVPQIDGSDTDLFVKYAHASNLSKEDAAREGESSIFNGTVALRRFDWDEGFLKRYEHAPFDHPSIQEAEALIALWPEVYEQFGKIVKAFNPVLIKGVEDHRNYGGSNSHQPDDTLGAVWATIHNPILLAQALVHEMAHNKLFSIGQHFTSKGPLFMNEEDELFDSPIRLDIPRPISAVFHGIYAFTHVLALDNVLFEKGNEADKMYFVKLMKNNALRVKKGSELIKKCAKLTPEGKAFVHQFMRWSDQEIKKALTTYATHMPKVQKRPLLLIGPESAGKNELATYLTEHTHKNCIYAQEHYLDILSHSSILKQKKVQMYGSMEVANLFEQSDKFSNKELLYNWMQSGVFSVAELEFMKLQFANHILKNNPDTIIVFDENHTSFKQPEFAKRLKQLFDEEYNAQVIYARPVAAIHTSVKLLNTTESKERDQQIHDLLYAPDYRTLSVYTFDTDGSTEKTYEELKVLVTV